MSLLQTVDTLVVGHRSRWKMPKQATSIHSQKMVRKGGHACTVLHMRRLRIHISVISDMGGDGVAPFEHTPHSQL